MATGTWVPYDLTFEKVFNGTLDLHSNANLYWMFTSSSHTPNRATHDFEADLTNIVSGTNLSSSGIALASPVISLSTNVIKWDATDLSVPTVTATGIRNIHLVDKTSGNSATNSLIMFCTLDGDISPSAGTLAITLDANGFFLLDLAP
jgi:hypothetical protein